MLTSEINEIHQSNKRVDRNLAPLYQAVKSFLGKSLSTASLFTRKCMTGGAFMLMVMTVPAHATPATERAIENAQHITTLLQGVLIEQMPLMITHIRDKKTPRLAPEQPIIIIDIVVDKVLYYEGRPDLAGTKASLLQDGSGQFFGQKALGLGRASRSTWMTLSFNGKNYRTYCKSQFPTVVCSMVP